MFGLHFAVIIVAKAVDQVIEVAVMRAFQLAGLFIPPVSPLFHGYSSLSRMSQNVNCNHTVAFNNDSRAEWPKSSDSVATTFLENDVAVLERKRHITRHETCDRLPCHFTTPASGQASIIIAAHQGLHISSRGQ